MTLIVSLVIIWIISSSAEALLCYLHVHPEDGHFHPDSSYLRPCGSADDCCATLALQEITAHENSSSVVRTCLPPALCTLHGQTSSISFSGITCTAYVHCCKTDGCNAPRIPYADPGQINGLKCSICTPYDDYVNEYDDYSYGAYAAADDDVCNSTLECVGAQNHCFNANVTCEDSSHVVAGCASANASGIQSAFAGYFKHAVAPQCCGTRFCNSTWTFLSSGMPELYGDKRTRDEAGPAGGDSSGRLSVVLLLLELISLII